MKYSVRSSVRWALGLAFLTSIAGVGVTARAANASLEWVDARGGHVPSGAIIGGWEPGRTLYVCRGWYRGGMHPGKIVGSNCNIGWGGNEVLLDPYEVLRGDNQRVRWVDASDGGVPPGAFSGGYEPGRPDLYICRVSYRGIQPGKIVGSNCNIGYGGKELVFSQYQVLVPE
jgi:hypothetical protein